MVRRKKVCPRRTAALLLVMSMARPAPTGAAPGPFPAVRCEHGVIETLKHRITTGSDALPRHIELRADLRSLPLEMRRDGFEPRDADLIPLGRGPLLRAPMRMEAVVDGRRRAVGIAEHATVTERCAERVTFRSALSVDGRTLALTVHYEYDGAIVLELSGDAMTEPPDRFEWVMELNGRIDFACRGLPPAFWTGEKAPDVSAFPSKASRVWDSRRAPSPAGDGDGDGAPHGLVFGSFDRAFTWLADGQDPACTIERDETGRLTVRLHLTPRAKPNRTADGTHRYALLLHPSRPRPDGRQRTQWLEWFDAGTANASDGLDAASLAAFMERRSALYDAARTAATTPAPGVPYFAASGIELSGWAGADVTPETPDHMRLYPHSLFGALAGPFHNRPTRIRSNVRNVVPGGADPRHDRQILGRALTMGIGAAIDGFSRPVDFLRTVRLLKNFGWFDDDDATDMLPHWRNRDIVRYGEPWDASDPFNLTITDPAEGVYVTALRQERDDRGGVTRHVLLVVVNENRHPVRQPLFIADPQHLFGGPNRLFPGEIDPDGDPFAPTPGAVRQPHETPHESAVLWDIERRGGDIIHRIGRYAPAGPDIYGPVFIGPHDFRLLYGRGHREP